MSARRGGYLRPLLGFEKEELLHFAEAEGLPFVEDETNRETVYLRNFLRQEVLPLLNCRQEGSFSAGVLAAMSCLREEDEALSIYAAKVQDTALSTLAALPKAVLKRVLDRVSGRVLPRAQFDQIWLLLQRRPTAGQVQLPGGLFFRVEYGNCRFVKPEGQVRLPVTIGEPLFFGEQTFMIRSTEINKPFTHFLLDYDKIEGDLIFRHELPGDRFVPIGGGGSSRLHKRLKNDRVPRSARECLWVLANGQDQILWVQGYGADRRAGCDAATRRSCMVWINQNEGEQNQHDS